MDHIKQSVRDHKVKQSLMWNRLLHTLNDQLLLRGDRNIEEHQEQEKKIEEMLKEKLNKI